MARGHPAHRLAGTQHGAKGVDREHAREARHVHLFHPSSTVDHPGIVDQTHQRPKRISLGEESVDIRLHGHIRLNGNGGAAPGDNLFADGVGREAVGRKVDHDAIPALGRQQRYGCPDAARSAGYNNDAFVHPALAKQKGRSTAPAFADYRKS
jgi:hypothetical protein